MIRECDIAYLAGVVDSDGCIRVERLRNHGRSADGISYAAFVAIGQVEPHAVELAHATFGGFVLKVNPTQKKPHARPMFRWTAKSRIASCALDVMRPYLRIKAAQADNAIALARLVEKLNRDRYVGVIPGRTGPRCRTPQELDQLAAYFNESRRLNSGELNPEYGKLAAQRTAQTGMQL